VLRSFRVANHKSIKDEQELVLLPAYDKARSVVPVTAIFGANASGKSNLLDALRWFRSAVRGSFGWEPGAEIPREPFRLDPDFLAAPSTFAVDLLLDGVSYTYGCELDDRSVRQEWLYSYPQHRKRVIFEREGRSWRFGTGVGKPQLLILSRLTRENALFLTVAARGESPALMPVYRWFQQALGFEATSDTGPDPYDVADLSGAHRDLLVRLLRLADLGIADVRAEWVSSGTPSNDPFAAPARPELRFMHGPQGVPLRMADQSRGTRTWLSVLVPSLVALEDGGVLCVDEIDSSLHPRLTARLIELFRDPEANPAGAQLIFTTHDATLLGTSFGEEILRRDEIWFVEKRDGASSLYPLTDFHPRQGENRERRYLGGSYGAVPAVFSDSFVEGLKEARSEQARVSP
jgi:hypothetical protein